MAYAHLVLEIRCAKDLASDPKLFGSQDVFVSGTVQPSATVILKTKVAVGGGSNPSFDVSLENRLRFVLGGSDTSITLQVHSSGHIYDKLLGSVEVNVKEALQKAANSEPAALALDTAGELHLTFRTPPSRGKHRSSENSEVVAPLLIQMHSARCLPDRDLVGRNDPYATAICLPSNRSFACTECIENGGSNPSWSKARLSQLELHPLVSDDSLVLEVWNGNFLADELIGCVVVKLDTLAQMAQGGTTFLFSSPLPPPQFLLSSPPHPSSYTSSPPTPKVRPHRTSGFSWMGVVC
jgi:hypothetical protein